MSTVREKLKDPLSVRELWLDLGNGEQCTGEILEFENLESLTLRDVPREFKLGFSLAPLTRLKRLSISFAGDRKELHQIPRELLDVPFTSVELSSRVRPQEVVEFRAVDDLVLTWADPDADLRVIVNGLPGLRRLKIWESHDESANLAAEIGSLSRLEALSLVSCKLASLPATIGNLGTLRELELKGLPMGRFPETICHLAGLEALTYQVSAPALPESLAALRNLRKLDLYGAWNNGKLISREGDLADLAALPPVLSRLVTLETLDIGSCGVTSLAALAPLKKLSSLALGWSGLTDLDGLRALPDLRELDLKKSKLLADLSGLAWVPRLRHLSLNSCERITDLAVLDRLPELEVLEIEGCRKISDTLPIFRQPSLKSLKAWPRLSELFRNRARIASLSAEGLRSDIAQARDAASAAQALDRLSTWVQFFSTNTTHGLATLFSVAAANDEDDEDDEESRPRIDTGPLDEMVSRWAAELDAGLCARVVTECLRHLGDDLPFLVTLMERIVAAGDWVAARQVVKRFWKAEENSDDDRWSPSTVALAERFGRCDAATQAEALEPAEAQHLLPDSDRPMAHLLVSATKAARPGDGVEEQAIEKTCELVTSYSDSLGLERIEAIVAPVREVASPEGRQLLSACIGRIERRDVVRNAVRQRDAKVLNHIFSLCGKEIIDRELEDIADLLGSGVLDKVEGIEEKAVLEFLGALLEHEEELWPVREAIAWLARRGPAVMSRTRELLSRYPHKSKFVGEQVRLKLKNAGSVEQDPHATLLSELADELLGLDPGLALERDQERRLNEFLKGLENAETAHAFAALLAQRERPFDLDEGGRIDLMIQGLSSLVRNGKYEPAFALFAAFDKLGGSRRSQQRLLRDFLAAACLVGDYALAERMVAAISGDVIVDGLAFNLACWGARTGSRERVLAWVRRAVELGKKERAFLEEPDFAPFKDSAEFLAAIAGSPPVDASSHGS